MIEFKNVSKTYRSKNSVEVAALRDVSLIFGEVGLVFVLGKSGSGKSTLLNIVGGLDSADSGELIVRGKSGATFTQSDYDGYRNTLIGFVFQEYNLLEDFSVGANIALAIELQGKKATSEAVNSILEEVDLQGYANRKPSQLSGGQKQRVAIARALVKSPDVIMADEPTGALDSNTGKMVFDTLKKLSKDKLVLVVSHDREFAEQYGDRVIELADGKVVSDISKHTVAADSSHEGIDFVDGKLLRIRKDYELTDQDVSRICDYLKNRNPEEDTLISMDGHTNTEIKKLARIDDEGNREVFRTTVDEEVTEKHYEPDEQVFLRSRLPYKASFRMGVSGLKHKRFRLAISIILSAIALALFGITSTIATYDPIRMTVDSIADSHIDYAAFTKSYSIDNGDYVYYRYGELDESDITVLEQRFSDMSFIPVFGSSNLDYYSYYDSGFSYAYNLANSSKLNLDNNYGGSYYRGAFSGLAEITSAQLDAFGFELTGRLPETDDEIAVTAYCYEHFAKGGYKYADVDDSVSIIESYEALIGKELNINVDDTEKNLTIVGIIDTHLDGSRYEQFKEVQSYEDGYYDQSGVLQNSLLQTEMNDVLSKSFHALCLVNNGYINRIIEARKGIVAYGSRYELMLSSEKLDYLPMSLLYTEQEAEQSRIRFFDDDKTSLGAGETLISVASLNDIMFYDGDYVSVGTLCAKREQALLKKYAADNLDTYLSQMPQLFEEVEGAPSDATYRTKCIERLCLAFTNGSLYLTNSYGKAGVQLKRENSVAAIDYVLETYSEQLLKPINLRVQYGTDVKNAEFSIVGIYDIRTETVTEGSNAYPSDNYIWVFSASDIAALALPANGKYSTVLSAMPKDKASIQDIIEYTYDDGIAESDYKVTNSVTTSVNTLSSFLDILSNIFLYVGLGLAVFSALMQMNFISTSITYKRREIGILRAVGARGADVLGIFFNESLVITLINLLVAIIMCVATTITLNAVLRSNYGLMITILNFGIIQVLLMLAVSIAVAVLGSTIPVVRFSRKKPIDTIRG